MHTYEYGVCNQKEMLSTLFLNIYGENGARSTSILLRGLAVRGEMEVGDSSGCPTKIKLRPLSGRGILDKLLILLDF